MTAHAMTAPPGWSIQLINDLDVADHRAKELAGQLTTEQLNWQPAPGVWSVGQCLEHLCITNELYLPPISASLENKPVAPVPQIMPGRFSDWFLRNYIEPLPQTKRASAPKKVVPASRIERSVLDRFVSGNQATREIIRRAAPHDVNRIRFKNPFIPGLRFTIGTGLQLICGHERRHLLQAERVRALPGFPDLPH
jgi:hypothetical protein